MDLLDKVKEFATWPKEIQQACVYQFNNGTATVPNVYPVVVSEHRLNGRKVARENNQHRIWTDDDKLVCFEEWDKNGWNKKTAYRLAKQLGRTQAGVRSQYDTHYKTQRHVDAK